MHKPIICLDFDGVLHNYNSGWQGVDIIPDADLGYNLGCRMPHHLGRDLGCNLGCRP